MSGEWEGMEEERRFFCRKRRETLQILCREVMMKSVGITEEEVKLNTPVPEPYIIPSSS